jgi:hypothetical protein
MLETGTENDMGGSGECLTANWVTCNDSTVCIVRKLHCRVGEEKPPRFP